MEGVRIERIRTHRDERGTVFDPFVGEELRGGKIVNVHVATMKPGAVRGNHRHTRQTETVVFTGHIKCVFLNGDGIREENLFREDECVRITISPGIAHAFRNDGGAETFLVCASDVSTQDDRLERIQLV
jgi:dTDP-4-dehydrorhamnose 3,5-epimerase-like enzyme